MPPQQHGVNQNRGSFRVSHASGPSSVTSPLPMKPRTDLNMARQKGFVAIHYSEMRFERLNAIEKDDQCGTSNNDRCAMLIQLLHEARRYQQERLARRGMDIDDCTSSQPGTLLTSDVCSSFRKDIEVLMNPTTPTYRKMKDNYHNVLLQLSRYKWFSGMYTCKFH